MERWWLAGTMLAWTAVAGAATGGSGMTDFLRRAEYERVALSPDGASLAIAYRKGEGTIISVLRRADMQPIARIDPGDRGEVSALAWMGPSRLVIAANRSSARYHAPIVQPAMYLVELGRAHPTVLPASFFDTVEGNDEAVLTLGCSDFSEEGECLYSLDRRDIRRLDRKAETLVVAPVADATFLVDHAGVPRFAWGWSDTGRSRLFVRSGDGHWKLLNDSDETHLGVVPMAVARDNRTAFLISERADGPDAIERYDFATGRRTELLRDTVSDPLSLIYSMDGKEPIGAWFGPGRPQARYWMPESEDAKWHRAIAKAFAGSTVDVVTQSADGSVAILLVRSDRDSGTYYVLDRATHKVSLLFHARPWLDASRMSASQPFEFTARDALTLHGFVNRPLGANGPGPMVVMVHGGPYLSADDWDFDGETQLLAAQGYTVLRVNFRGSAGFGRHFMELGYRQWAGAMVDDLTDATRWAIASGIADPRRICIYGASYGAFAALVSVAREPRLYRCAIGLSGVYDLSKMYRWGDIHRSDYGMHYLGVVLGTDKQALQAQSPTALAPAIKVPVLLAHGTLDTRVPMKHAKAMRSALEDAGNRPEFVTYEWEGHGLNDPEHLEDF